MNGRHRCNDLLGLLPQPPKQFGPWQHPSWRKRHRRINRQSFVHDNHQSFSTSHHASSSPSAHQTVQEAYAHNDAKTALFTPEKHDDQTMGESRIESLSATKTTETSKRSTLNEPPKIDFFVRSQDVAPVLTSQAAFSGGYSSSYSARTHRISDDSTP